TLGLPTMRPGAGAVKRAVAFSSYLSPPDVSPRHDPAAQATVARGGEQLNTRLQGHERARRQRAAFRLARIDREQTQYRIIKSRLPIRRLNVPEKGDCYYES